MYMYVQTQRKSLRASTHQSIKRSFFSMGGSMTIIFLSFMGGGGVDF